MTIPASSLPEDPWDWNTDQVVTALCDPTAVFRATNNARALPDATFLEQKLREHFIEGPGLLSDLELATLRDELGIKAVGHRGHIIREIRRLRRTSQQYVDQIRQDDTSNSHAGRPSIFGPTRYTTPLLQQVHTPSGQTIPPDTPAQSTLVAAEVPKSPTPAPRATAVSGAGQAQVPTSVQYSQEWLDQLPDSSEAIGPGSPVKSIEHQLPDRPEETYVIDENGRKRRRLVLPPVAASASKEYQGRDTVDTHSTAHQNPEERPPIDISAPQIPISNDADQKRITPTLLTQSSKNPPLVTVSAKRKIDSLVGSRPRENYLGIRALPVDDVFYDHEDQDQHLGVVEDFVFAKIPASTGQRRYISGRMKYFLRQRANVFQRGNKACNGICPYPDSFGQKHQSLSITIYDCTPHGILATRRDRSQWRLISSALSSLKSDGQDSAIDNGDKLVTLPSDDGQNWDYLNKWDDVHGNNDVLPVYGESGSEGDYDSDTWREMEKEQGVLPKTLGRPRRLQMIGVQESTNTIDQAVQRMVADWKEKRLPKLERTAWTIWSRSRRNASMKATVLSLQHELQHLETRLTKLRKGIAGQHWLSAARVTRQCECMRRTVYGVEDSRWTIGVLELEHRPMKPRTLHKGKRNPSLFGEETNEAQSTQYESSSEEDLGGFIVRDDEVSDQSDNGGLIGNGNEDVMMSQSSTNNDRDDGNEGTDDDRSDTESSQTQRQASAGGGKSNFSSPRPPKEVAVLPVARKPGPGNFVDLTLSDTSEPEAAPDPKSSKANNIRTPFAHSADIDVNEEPSQRSQRKAAGFRIPPGTEIKQNVTIDLEKDDTSESDTELSTASELPRMSEIKEISEMDRKLLMKQGDRRRLLIYILAQKGLQQRKDANAYVIRRHLDKAQRDIWNVLSMLRRARSKVVDGGGNEQLIEVHKNITAWYICWASVEIIRPHDGATEGQIELAEADKEGFATFYAFLKELRCLSDFETSPATSSDKAKTTPSKQRRSLIDYSDEETAATPTKKRKYAVPESQEAADTRQKAHQRIADREKRQSKLKKTLQRMGKTEEDPSQVVVNMGKLDHQDLICLLPSIGERIQPHQKDGLRFLWREIIEDHASKQGCLLAQTMGLGKTMQVISFLITVADAARSSNANVREQIPRRLMRSQTLVLCPPTLVENWYDEFLIWAPQELADNIGDVRTVSSTMPLSDRLRTIRDWDKEGGILVLPFSILRSMIENPIRNGQAQLSETQHLMVKRVLLERPNIVVADEAHTFKNPTAQIARIMRQFGSSSRIALTGSPLSNSLSEYYALIEWIAPGYLGEPTEFRSHYEEPISQGLYRDSSVGDYRRGLKKLELFKREVAPKIHRADLTVLQTSLKGKSEFVIKVAPTELQEQLYQLFISSMTEQLKGAEVQMKLLVSICILRLICNHPQCYYDHLTRSPTKGRKPVQAVPGDEVELKDDPDLSTLSPGDLGLSEIIIRHQLEPFKNLPVPIGHVSLANKMKVLLQILDLSMNAGDKVLVFTHSIPTLDYIEKLLQKEGKTYVRMDGSVRPDLRQELTKDFNRDRGKNVFIISTRAGGTGLNLAGASRVVIMDDGFNPTWEEQAVGRAYRIGQTKPVFVYRLTVGGTVEDVLHNQSLFKQQLATRAVDKKNIARSATRELKDYFQPLKTVEQTDLKPFQGKDPEVLDYILASQNAELIIREIVPCETFKQEIDEKLTDEEQKEVELLEADSRLRRADPTAYQARLMAQSAPKSTETTEARGTQAASRNAGVAMPTPPVPPSGHAGEIIMTSTPGIASAPIVDLVPPTPSLAARGLSNTAKLFGDLVPHGNGMSTVDQRQVNGGARSQAPAHAVPPMQPPVGPQHPMRPILGASTTLRTAASVPPKPQHVATNAAQRAESEPQPTLQPAKGDASPSKGCWVKYPQLQGLLDREAQRTKHQ